MILHYKTAFGFWFWNKFKVQILRGSAIVTSKIEPIDLFKNLFGYCKKGENLELVSKELNHFGEITSFFRIGHQGHWQVVHKQRFIRHLSVSLEPNLRKTTWSPPRWFNSLDTNSRVITILPHFCPTCVFFLSIIYKKQCNLIFNLKDLTAFFFWFWHKIKV